MLIIKNGIVINLDNVKSFYVRKLDYLDKYVIFFKYIDKDVDDIGDYDTQKEALKVFNEIIANYSSGKKVYVIE